ncbi:hypothetical protein LHA01_14420 [Schleiferilactobacillus harbinensis]|jgi:hypothetical protein|uniref:Uncharacterized protein n=1 Tax=Schleiferilactobacillus harbinensis DSM 16991 TaxID=1122147 RepID=A0A0R1XCR6_9LACO|nr:hypothetical protein FC91_GL000620 [Schleiferilactobacillus harbinensis DSM 16991]GEK06203.1 hypothetical protein LHA01_14420 [Schleiferilactobacillus harbinensis]HAY54117.1 hypothetical protein [Lactobacillus sp.]
MPAVVSNLAMVGIFSLESGIGRFENITFLICLVRQYAGLLNKSLAQKQFNGTDDIIDYADSVG